MIKSLFCLLLGLFVFLGFQDATRAGKMGNSSQEQEINFLTEVFQIIMPVFVKTSYANSDANFMGILRSGYEFCQLSPQQIQEAMASVSGEEERIIASALQEIAPKYLCR